MNRTLLTLATTLVIASPALALGAVDVETAPQQQVFFPGGPLPVTETCTATAPTETSCTSGTHIVLRTPINQISPISHGFTGVNLAGYTGTVESKLAWTDVVTGASGARVFRCNVLNGAISCMPGFGAFPPQGVNIVAHECRSYDRFTTTPGGTGNWGCAFTFTGVPDAGV